MRQKEIDVSVIVVNYNTLRLTTECLESIFTFTKGVRYEVIVVDNNSTDGSLNYLETLTKQKKIRLIKNKENVGFAKANNQAFEVAEGSAYLLLNSDTKLQSDAISSVFHSLFSSPDTGIATCTLHNADGSLQPSGGYFPTVGRLVTWMFFIDDLPFFGDFVHSYHPKISYFSSTHTQDWITGAFFMIKRNVVDSIGGLDPEYFMYVEEMDFCFRAKKQGFNVLFDASESIIHFGQGSGSNTTALLMELKNLTLFYKKHMKSQYQLAKLLIKLGALARMVLFAILGRGSLSKTYAQAFSEI